MIGLFSFFAGAGFLDLGFEMTGHFKNLHSTHRRQQDALSYQD